MKKPRLSDNWNLFNDKTFEDKKYYLFNVTDGSIIKLNKISYDILEKCNGDNSLENIKKQLLEKYEVNENELENDIYNLLSMAETKSVLLF